MHQDAVAQSTGVEKSFDHIITYAYPDDGVVIGQGWNSFAERGTVSRCVDVIEVPIESSTFTNDFKEIKSLFSLFKKQTISIAASGSFGGFSGSGSYSSEQSQKLDTENINLLYEFRSNVAGTRAVGLPDVGLAAHNEITELSDNEGFQVLKEAAQVSAVDALLSRPLPSNSYQIRLSNKARMFATLGDAEGFQAICGDGFVSAIQRGTEVKVLASYNAKTVENRSKFKAAAEGGGFGMSASASKETEAIVTETSKDTQFKIFQTGGAPLAPPSDFNGLRSILSDGTQFIVNPAAYEIQVTPYSALRDEYEFVKSIVPPANLKRLAEYYVILRDHYRSIEYILIEQLAVPTTRKYNEDIVKAYGGIEHLTRLRDKIHSDLEFIESNVANCVNTGSGCTFEAVIADAQKKIDENKALIADYDGTRDFLLSLDLSIESQGNLPPITDSQSTDLNSATASQATQELLTAFGQKNFASIDLKSYDAKALEAARSSFGNEISIIQGVERLQDITDVFSEENSKLGNAFFQRFYSYLLETPLPESILMKTTYDNTKANSDQRKKDFRNAIYLHRLAPWRDYFCEEALSDLMCFSDSELWGVIETANFSGVDQEYRIQKKECHPAITNKFPHHKSPFFGDSRWLYNHPGYNFVRRGKKLNNALHCRTVTLPHSQ